MDIINGNHNAKTTPTPPVIIISTCLLSLCIIGPIVALYVCGIVIAHNNETNPCIREWDNVSVHYIKWLYIYGGTNLIMLAFGIGMGIYLWCISCRSETPTVNERLFRYVSYFTIPFSLFMSAWMIYGAVLYWEEIDPTCDGTLKQYGLANFIIHCISFGFAVLAYFMKK